MRAYIVRKSDEKVMYYGEPADKPGLGDPTLYYQITSPRPTEDHYPSAGAWVIKQSEIDAEKKRKITTDAANRMAKWREKALCHLEQLELVKAGTIATTDLTAAKFLEIAKYRYNLMGDKVVRGSIDLDSPAWPTEPTI